MPSRPPRSSLRTRWAPRSARVALVTAVVASLLLPTAPAHAGGTWTDVDLIALTGAPAGDAPFGFFTNLPGEGPTARIVYRTHAGELEELYAGSDLTWRARRLTKGGDVYSSPVGYVTTLAGKAFPVARILYGDHRGHIQELTNPGTGVWTMADLTTISGGPLRPTDEYFDNIHAFTTALPGQAPTAHVLYPADHDLEDLSLSAGGTWHPSVLTSISDVESAGEGYVTQLAGQGPVARIVYGTLGHTIRELASDGYSTWSGADISTIAGVAPSGPVAPHPYATNLPGQGPVARVLYLDYGPGPDERPFIGELSVVGGGTWQANTLTPSVGSWTVDDPDSNARGYTTNLPGEGQVARVVYKGLDHHIKELSSNGGPWSLVDLTVLTAGPPFGGRNMPWDPPMGYTSNLPGEGPAARVVYNTINGEIHEMIFTG